MLRSKKKAIKAKDSKLSALRVKLTVKNQSKAPQKHHMCRKFFINYIKQCHSDMPDLKKMYPVTRRTFKDVHKQSVRNQKYPTMVWSTW